MISVEDNSIPTINCPEDITISCEADPSPNNTGMATSMDNCATAIISSNDIISNGNCANEYTITRIWTASGQLRLNAGGRPLKLGLDLIHNGEAYSPMVVNRDETDGAVVSVFYGKVKERGDWQATTRFSRSKGNCVERQADWQQPVSSRRWRPPDGRLSHASPDADPGNGRLRVRLRFLHWATHRQQGCSVA